MAGCCDVFLKTLSGPPPNPPDTFENDMTQTNARKTPTTSSSPSVKRTSASPAPSDGTSSDGTAASGEFSSSSSASWIPPLCPPPAPPPAPLPARHYPSCFTPPHLPAFLYLCLKLTLSCTPAGQPILSSKSDRTLRYPKWPTFVGYLIFCIFLNSLYE